MSNYNSKFNASYVKDVFASVFRLLFSLVMNVFILSLITRSLGEVGRGMYAGFILYTEAAALFTGFGLQFYLSYYAATVGLDKKLKSLMVKVVLLSTILSTLIVYYFLNLGTENSVNCLSLSLITLIIYILFSVCNSTVTVVMQGLKLFTFIAKIEIARLIMFTLILLCFFYIKIAVQIEIIIYVMIATNMFAFISGCYCIVAKNKSRLDTISNKNSNNLKPSLAIKSWVSDLLGYCSYRVNWFFIDASLSVASLAHYSAASQLAEKIWALPASVSQVVTSYAATSAKNAVDSTVVIVKIIFVFSVILALILIAFSDAIVIVLFGDEFASASPILVILLLGTVPMALTKVFAAYLAGIGKIKYNLCTLLLLLITNAICLWGFGRKGVVAVSYSVVCGYVVATISSLYFFCKECGVHPIICIPHFTDFKKFYYYLMNIVKSRLA